METKKFYRHGDMFLIKIGNINIKATKVKKDELVIGLGEVTGHKHIVKPLTETSELFYFDTEKLKNETSIAEQEKLFFEIKGSAVITHEEHNPIVLDEGTYVRIVQVNYDPFKRTLNKIKD